LRGTVTIFPNNRRALLAFAHDVLMAALSVVASLYLRLGGDIVHYKPPLTITYILSFTLIASIVFLLTGLYRGIWRYASLPDLFNIARAVTLTVAIFLPVMFVVIRLEALPRSTLLIDWFVLIALLGAPRLAYRLFKDRGLDHIFERAKHPSVPVLLISTKDGADTFIREVTRDPRAVYRVVGVLADTPSRVGREIYRVPVLGTIDALEAVVERLDRRGRRPQKLIVTAQNLSGAQIRELLERADALAIPLARLPRLTDFRHNLDNVERAVEPIALEDLLGRPQAVLDRDGMARLIAGRRVLVTGAGGTIGAELARQIAAFSPARLVLLDNGEFALYAIDAELRERFAELALLPLLRDVREREEVDEVIGAERPEIVFHAADPKASADGRGQPDRGCVDQHNRQPECRRSGARLRCLARRHDLDRQSGQPDERTRRHQTPRRKLLPGARLVRGAWPHILWAGYPLRHGALRQRAWLDRIGCAVVRAPACCRWTADCHRPRGRPLFHDGARGRRAGLAGFSAVACRRDD